MDQSPSFESITVLASILPHLALPDLQTFSRVSRTIRDYLRSLRNLPCSHTSKFFVLHPSALLFFSHLEELQPTTFLLLLSLEALPSLSRRIRGSLRLLIPPLSYSDSSPLPQVRERWDLEVVPVLLQCLRFRTLLYPTCTTCIYAPYLAFEDAPLVLLLSPRDGALTVTSRISSPSLVSLLSFFSQRSLHTLRIGPLSKSQVHLLARYHVSHYILDPSEDSSIAFHGQSSIIPIFLRRLRKYPETLEGTTITLQFLLDSQVRFSPSLSSLLRGSLISERIRQGRRYPSFSLHLLDPVLHEDDLLWFLKNATLSMNVYLILSRVSSLDAVKERYPEHTFHLYSVG